MTDDAHPVLQLDDRVHQRARLGVLAILCEVDEADFSTLRSTLELTPGNLSQHLSILEEAKLIKIRKIFEGKRPRTWVKMTSAGRRAYAEELEQLQTLIARYERQARSGR